MLRNTMSLSRAEIISVVALLVSILGISSSFYFGLRDRARLVTASKFYPWHEGQEAHVCISIANAGRRPVVLRMWVGAEREDHWAGMFLRDAGQGLRLAEHDRHDLRLTKSDLCAITPGDDVLIQDVWYEDNIGNLYKINAVKHHIAQLRDT